MENGKITNEEGAAMIPYYRHEIELFRLERRGKRLSWAIVAGLVLLVASNAAWIVYALG